MKKQFLYKSLFLITFILLPKFTYTKIEGDFESIAYKPYPGEKFEKMIKTVNEIPQFKNITPEQKTAWNKLANQINEMIKSDLQIFKRLQPLRDQLLKLGDNLDAKRTQLNQKLEQLLKKNNPEFSKLRTKAQALDKQLPKIDSIINQINQLEQKQDELIVNAYKKEYGSVRAAMDTMNIQQTTEFDDKTKKSKEYQDLEKQLAPLKAQRKQIEEKSMPILKQIYSIGDQLNKIKNDTKQSKDLPAPLKKLNAEVEQLEKQWDALRKQLREREKKLTSDASQADKMQLLRQLFDSIKKESK